MKIGYLRITAFLCAVVMLAGCLAGCTPLSSYFSTAQTISATTIVNPLQNKQVGGVEDALGLAGSIIKGYAHLPACPDGTTFQPNNWCHDKGVLASIDKAQNVAVAAVSDLVAFQEANPAGTVVVGTGFSAKLDAANTAINALKGLLKSYAISGATS